MATYLQGVTDQIPNIQPFQPNFGLVQQALSTLQARYDRGFASVQNVYNQVMNAPLSVDENKSMRDAFLKNSQLKLKDIASVDLSLPENQAVAENVFAPFWEDNLILQDTGLTKWYQGEIQKGLSIRDSPDEKIREQYSDAAMQWLGTGLRQLEQAGRDPQKYAQLEKRRFVPFKNIQKYLNEEVEKRKFKVESVTADGNYLVTTENGEQSIVPFETFAHNMLGEAFQDQFMVMGAVEKEARIDNVRKANPLWTDQQVMEEVAKGVTKELKTAMTSGQEKLKKEQETTKRAIEAYMSLGNLLPEQEVALKKLGFLQASLEEQFENGEKKLKEFDATNEKKTQENVLQSPNNYFASALKQQAVSGWANASAANKKETVVIDPVWKEKDDIAYRNRQLEILKRTADREDKLYELKVWEVQHPKSKKGKRSGSSSSLFSSSSTDTDSYTDTDDEDEEDMQNPQVAGRVEAVDATDIAKTDKTYQIFTEDQQQRLGMANRELFSEQVAGRVLYGLGLYANDVVKYRTSMEKLIDDPDGKSLNFEERKQLHIIDMKLTGKKTAVPGDINLYKLRTNLLEAIRKDLATKYKEGGPGTDEKDEMMLAGYLSATHAMQEHDALEEHRKILVKEHITKDPEKYGTILTQKDGKYDVSNVDDIAKDFKPITLVAPGSRDKYKLSAKEFAELYISGDFKYDLGTEVFIKGQRYSIEEFDGKKDSFWGSNAIDAFTEFYYDNHSGLQHRYGSSSEQKKLRDELNDKVIPNLPEYQSKTGKQGYVIRYDLSKKSRGDVGAKLINEASYPANHLGFYINGDHSTSDKKNAAIMRLMKLNEEDMEQYISTALIKPTGPTGRPALELVLKPDKTSDKTAVVGVDLTDLTDIERIDIELNPQGTGTTLNQLRYNAGLYVFGSLMRGKPLLSDPILEQAGYALNIIPNHPERPTGAIVELKYKEYENGKLKNTIARQEYLFNDITPDELVSSTHGQIWQQMKKNKEDKEQIDNKMKQQAGEYRTPQQVWSEVQQQIKLRGGGG